MLTACTSIFWMWPNWGHCLVFFNELTNGLKMSIKVTGRDRITKVWWLANSVVKLNIVKKSMCFIAQQIYWILEVWVQAIFQSKCYLLPKRGRNRQNSSMILTTVVIEKRLVPEVNHSSQEENIRPIQSHFSTGWLFLRKSAFLHVFPPVHWQAISTCHSSC